MTPKRWLALLAFYISYLLFGASIYYHIENKLEREQRAEALQQRIEINEYLTSHLSSKDAATQSNILERISDYCDRPVTNYTLDKYEDPYRWTFYHSLFFAFTVCSTVGYGNLSPSTTLGQMIMIAYSLIGIPINGILFAGLGDFFSRTFTGIYHRYKKYKMFNDDKYVPRQFGLFATVMIALVPGITFFIILPSLIFSYFEGWPYTLSLYYSYVTTTTIGFGDYVPTFQPHQERSFGVKFIFYQIFIIVWFIFSLGYLLMIMTFITKGLRSKKLADLEHQLSVNIKATQNRIWHGVTKDVGYLRRILNELYIMKFKPVYNEPGEKYSIQVPRSASCPDLTMYRVETPIVGRKRAFSENYDIKEAQEQLALGTPLHPALMRVSSDTDLEKINKQKTFEKARSFMETTDLLAKVVTALAGMRPPQDQDVRSLHSTGTPGGPYGYHGFTDSQILASEGTWTSRCNEHPIRYQRSRACSDFYISPQTIPPPNIYNEWTWGGDNDQIQQVINKRVKSASKQKDLYKASFQVPTMEKSTILNMESNDGKDEKASGVAKSFLKRLIPFKKKSSASVPEGMDSSEFEKIPDTNYTTITVGDQFSYKDNKTLLDAYKQTGKSIGVDRRPSGFSFGERRGSAVTTIEASNVFAAGRRPPFSETDRRRSMFATSDRRGSLFASSLRRGSLLSGNSRRGSLFSVPSQEEVNADVLENTTIADLIRALEVIHTHAALTENKEPPPVEQPPKRKLGTASLSPPVLPPLFTLFSQGDKPPTGNYSRRSTIFGSLTNQSPQTTVMSRRSSLRPPLSPPPYTEKESPKFKRRFSVRPTNLQTPPGKAPPVTTSKAQLTPQSSQTALQRRLSLRPSPLARETVPEASTSGISPSIRNIFIQQIPNQSSLGRGPANTTSSTHSPLSRMAQIQASRKGSVPESAQPEINSKEPK